MDFFGKLDFQGYRPILLGCKSTGVRRKCTVNVWKKLEITIREIK